METQGTKVVEIHPNIFKRIFYLLLGIKHNKTLISQHGPNFLISREIQFRDNSLADYVELTHVKANGTSKSIQYERKKHK